MRCDGLVKCWVQPALSTLDTAQRKSTGIALGPEFVPLKQTPWIIPTVTIAVSATSCYKPCIGRRTRPTRQVKFVRHSSWISIRGNTQRSSIRLTEDKLWIPCPLSCLQDWRNSYVTRVFYFDRVDNIDPIFRTYLLLGTLRTEGTTKWYSLNGPGSPAWARVSKETACDFRISYRVYCVEA